MKVRHALLMLLPLLGLALFLLRDSGSEGTPQPTRPAERSEPAAAYTPYRPAEGIPPLGEGPRPVPLPELDAHAIPGEFIVFFPDAASQEAFQEAAEAAGIRVIDGIGPFLALRVAGSPGDLQSLLGEGMQVDGNFRMQAPTLPDSAFWTGGNLSGFGQGMLQFLGAPLSPERFTWGQGITVAVLDTGWLGHVSQEAVKVRQIDLLGPPYDGEFSGHGTAVGGLIASTSAFAPGIAPGTELLSVRVLDGAGQGDAFTLAKGILAAVDGGADVINMSLGGYGDSEVLRQAVDYAVDRGVVLVAASGNDGFGQLTFPARYESVIGVTAVDANGNRPGFANFGDGLDLAAPGYQVHALWGDESYVFFNGTSASAPLVSGMVARILETGKADTPEAVRELLHAQANDTGLPGSDPQYGQGILDAARLEAVGQTGIHDLALADLYPAIEESDGASFPLYVSIQNRGTDYLPGATIELTVNGTPYFYRFSGMDAGAVQSVQVPVMESQLREDQPFSVSAKALAPDAFRDQRPGNNEAEISLTRTPGG